MHYNLPILHSNSVSIFRTKYTVNDFFEWIIASIKKINVFELSRMWHRDTVTPKQS